MKALVAVFFFTAILGAQDIDLTGYTLVFEDNFDTLSLVQGDGPIGNAKWLSYPPYGASAAFSQSKWGYADSRTFSVADGTLSIAAWYDPNLNYWTKWRSGIMASLDKFKSGFCRQFGYFSARMKMPNAGQGAWPAFWLYSSSSIPNNQAKRLEIDYEWYGNNPGQIQCAVHNWNADGSHTGGSRGFVNIPGSDAINTWHVYGILVRPDFIIHYIDGQEVWKTPSNPGYLDTPLFMMVDYALGGGWPVTGSPFDVKGTSAFLVDWVRAYELPAAVPSPPQIRFPADF